MGSPDIPKIPAAPPPVDQADAAIRAASYNATQKKIGQSSGRKGTFLTAADPSAAPVAPVAPKTLLGQ